MNKETALQAALDALDRELKKEPISPERLAALAKVIESLNSISHFLR
ncbi:hypothetical protein [Desulfitobacterium hafniense]|nr:hypothetical protein [Desulfitobacterium hafniense]